LHPLGEKPSSTPAPEVAERIARRAVGLALDSELSVSDAATLLAGDAKHDRFALEAARLRILRAASGPASQRAARAVWMAMQLVEADGGSSRTKSARHVLLIGMPGAGKGTQGRRLAAALDVPHIAMGDLIREVAREESPFGFQAQVFMERGLLVPDSLVLELVDRRFGTDDVRRRGFVLDGFPRTIEQAAALEVLLGARPVELVIELVVGPGTAHERLQARGRADDVTDAVARRVDDFEQRTAPVVYWYRSRAEVWSIDGERDVRDVTRDLSERVAAWDSHRNGI
jgi:adenylate kinase